MPEHKRSKNKFDRDGWKTKFSNSFLGKSFFIRFSLLLPGTLYLVNRFATSLTVVFPHKLKMYKEIIPSEVIATLLHQYFSRWSHPRCGLSP